MREADQDRVRDSQDRHCADEQQRSIANGTNARCAKRPKAVTSRRPRRNAWNVGWNAASDSEGERRLGMEHLIERDLAALGDR